MFFVSSKTKQCAGCGMPYNEHKNNDLNHCMKCWLRATEIGPDSPEDTTILKQIGCFKPGVGRVRFRPKRAVAT